MIRILRAEHMGMCFGVRDAIIGGAGSNNTRELVNTCRAHCSRVHHVQGEADLRREWFTAAATVGITAGTSTPDDAIDRIVRRIRQLSAE